MTYWLMKSEPDAYSIDDLERDGREPWDGIRNYQARNMMRDDMKVGDKVFFYHSNCKEPGVVGVIKVASKPYPDPTQFDPESKYYDPKSKEDDPRWCLVDVEFVRREREKAVLGIEGNYFHLEKKREIAILKAMGAEDASIERIFAIPGAGSHFVGSALNRDYTLVMGVVVFYGSLIIIFMLLKAGLIVAIFWGKRAVAADKTRRDQHRDEPFALWISTTTPHWPWE